MTHCPEPFIAEHTSAGDNGQFNARARTFVDANGLITPWRLLRSLTYVRAHLYGRLSNCHFTRRRHVYGWSRKTRNTVKRFADRSIKTVKLLAAIVELLRSRCFQCAGKTVLFVTPLFPLLWIPSGGFKGLKSMAVQLFIYPSSQKLYSSIYVEEKFRPVTQAIHYVPCCTIAVIQVNVYQYLSLLCKFSFHRNEGYFKIVAATERYFSLDYRLRMSTPVQRSPKKPRRCCESTNSAGTSSWRCGKCHS